MKPYQQILLFIAIGIAEFWLSYLNHKINLSVLMRKKKIATVLDFMANTISELVPFVIYVYTQNILFVIPRIIGNTFGTRVVAGRKSAKKKSVPRKKVPFTTV